MITTGTIATSLTIRMATNPAASAELAELTRLMVAGDDAAWEKFHRTYGPVMFRMLLAATRGDPHLASEAQQRAYLRIARHIRFCENEAQWLAWLRMIARSSLSDARRRHLRFWDMLRRRHAEPETASAEVGEEERMLTTLQACLEALAPELRDLLEAKYFQGQSMQAIAERLGISAKAVESRLTRARGELREQINARLVPTHE